jgi:hypothetical protein
MSQITDERSFLVLNGAHLKKMATPEEIAVAVGVDPELAERTLALAVANGWVMDMQGKFLSSRTEPLSCRPTIARPTRRCVRIRGSWHGMIVSRGSTNSSSSM